MNRAVNEPFNKKHKKVFTDFNTNRKKKVKSTHESTLIEKRDSSMKESSLMYFRLFPTHRNIPQRIPKKNPETIQNKSEDQPLDSIGPCKKSYVHPSKKRCHWNSNKNKPWQNKRAKCFDNLGEYSILNYRKYPRNKNVAPEEPVTFVQPPDQSSRPKPSQSFSQSTAKNTIVRVEEKTMSIQSENGNRQMICQKIRHIMNIETSVLNIVDNHEESNERNHERNIEQIDEYLQNIRNNFEHKST